MDYNIERAQRRVYTDHQLHLAVLELVGHASLGLQFGWPTLNTTHRNEACALGANCKLYPTLLVQVVSLLLRPDGSLDAMYTDGERTERKAQNVPYILQHHLEHSR
jgi:hypothetical protein